MKLATLPDGSRDGRLVVVSRDLTVCSDARHIAPSLHAALADWDAAAPGLDLIARGVEAQSQPVDRFHERAAAAPLPHAGASRFDDPRSAIAPAVLPGAAPGTATLTAEIGLAFLAGADGARPRLVAVCVDLGAAGATLSPVAATPDEIDDGVLSIEVAGPAPARIDAPLAPLALPAAAGPGVLRLDPVATLTLRPGDTLRVAYRDRAGRPLLGAIERVLGPAAVPGAAALTAIDHVLLAIPAGGEEAARGFYAGLLGLAETARPAGLAHRAGAWFAAPGVELHVGVEPEFAPARRAHPALRAGDLDGLAARLAAAGHPVAWDDAIAGRRRFFSADPAGNRLEFIADGDP